MNWAVVRKTNARRSAAKVRREQSAAQRKARIVQLGGPIKLDEIKAAERRTAAPDGNRVRPIMVWIFRGREWVIGWDGASFFRFCNWRMDGTDGSDYVPTTPAAAKWLVSSGLAPLSGE